MKTEVLGVEPSHCTLSFYSSTISEDEVRITNLFRQAQDEEWGVVQKSLSNVKLEAEVESGGNVLLVLVDSLLLNSTTDMLGREYMGHYIIVYRIRRDEEKKDGGGGGVCDVLDPARALQDNPRHIPLPLLHASR